MRLTRSGRCTFPCWEILVAVLFILSTLTAGSLVSHTVNAASGNTRWFLASSSNTDEVCEGDKVPFMVQWQTNFNYKDPTSLRGDDPVSPAGPLRILAKAHNGYFDPNVQTSVAASGITDFTYTASEKGTDTVTFQALNKLLEVDAQISKTFEVKECNLKVTLYVKDSLSKATEDGPVALHHVMQASGTLKKSDPKNLALYEVFDTSITDTFTVTQSADCTYSNPEYGHSSGILDIKAIREGAGFIVRIGPPREYTARESTTVKCPDSDPVNINLQVKPNITGDPWIETSHVTGEGKVSIDPLELNPGLSVLVGVGFSLTSDAYVVLEKEVK